MAKKNDVYEDFLKTVEERQKLIRKEKNKKVSISIIMLCISLLTFAAFSINSNIPLFPGVAIKKQKSIVQNLEKKVIDNENKINDINKYLDNNKTPSFVYLNSKIISLEQKNQYLYDTILENPDTAITPILLRKEQDNINEKIDDLRKRVDKTNSWLAGIFGTLVISMVLFAVKQIWESLSKKNTIKE